MCIYIGMRRVVVEEEGGGWEKKGVMWDERG